MGMWAMGDCGRYLGKHTVKLDSKKKLREGSQFIKEMPPGGSIRVMCYIYIHKYIHTYLGSQGGGEAGARGSSLPVQLW